LKYYQKQLLVLKEYRKNKLEKRIYLFLLVRKILRQKYLKSIYEALSSSNLNFSRLKNLFKEFKINELRFENFKYNYFINSSNNYNFYKYYIINKKFINKMKFYSKFYLYIKKVE
jgi:hypothetical protein